MTSYTDGAAKLADGINQLATGTSGLSNGVSRIDELIDASTAFSNGLQEMSGNISATDLTQLKNGLAVLQQKINNANIQVQKSEAQQKIASDFLILQDNISAIQIEQAKKIAQLKSTKAYQDNPNEQQVLEIIVSVSPSRISNLTSAVANLEAYLKEMQDENKASAAELANQSTQILSGSTGAIDGLTMIKTNLDQKLVPGAAQLNTGTKQLKSQLATGAAQISSVAEQLNSGAQSLVSHNAELTSGSAKLQDGASQLMQNGPALLGGANQLSSGANQISDGSAKLATGSSTLTSGLGSLTSGATALNSGLTDAKTKLNENKTTNTNAKKIASPVQLTHTDKDNSPKNGIGMAPYMMSVALFVGAVSVNMMISGSLSGAQPKNRKDYLLCRLGVNGLLAIGSAVLVYLVLHLLGLSANHEFKMFGFTLLVSICFMIIVTFFNTWLGKPGAFLVFILLLLQLGASGGTYPLALTSKFFQVLNPWMPMTYAVAGFRQVISLTGQIGKESIILLGISVVLTILLGLTGYKKAKS